jgi:hypothetical protein
VAVARREVVPVLWTTCTVTCRGTAPPAAALRRLATADYGGGRAVECQETRALHGSAQLSQSLPVAAGHRARLGSAMAAMAMAMASALGSERERGERKWEGVGDGELGLGLSQ